MSTNPNTPTPVSSLGATPTKAVGDWQEARAELVRAITKPGPRRSASVQGAFGVAAIKRAIAAGDALIESASAGARDTELLNRLEAHGAVFGQVVDYDCEHAFDWEASSGQPLREALKKLPAAASPLEGGQR